MGFYKKYKSVYLVSFIFTIVFLILYAFNFHLNINIVLSPFENKWYDSKLSHFRLGAREKEGDKRIIIAAIDEETIKKYGWPLPRRYYKDFIENLNKYGVKVIGFDILFIDPDRDRINDEIFATALKENKNVVIAFLLNENGEVVLPVKPLVDSTTNFASVSTGVMLGRDGILRRIYPFTTLIELNNTENVAYSYKGIVKSAGDIGFPLLGTYLYSFYSGIDLNTLYRQWHSELGDRSFKINFRKIIGGKGIMYKSISFKDIIEDKITDADKYALKNSIILAGSLTVGVYDHYPTPVFDHTPGVLIHALCIDNLLNNDYIRDVKWYIEILVLIISIWLAPLFIKNSILKISLYNFSYLIVLFIVSIILININYDLNFISYFLSNIASYLYVVAYKSIVEDREKRWIKNTFSQYLSPDVVEILVKDPSKLKLGGEKKEVSVYFMDIAGFTSISERLSPLELTSLLNNYLSELSDVILEYRGVIDKYIGDCIMAFWNAPIEIDNHQTMSVKAGLGCLKKVSELNRKLGFDLSVRIGINSGDVIVGNMGSNKRFSYTVIGDNVNLASRLEGANKYFNTNIMVSSSVFEKAKEDVYFNYIGKIIVVGKTTPVEVFRPYKLKDEVNEKDLEFIKNFENGIKYFYEKEYEKSLSYFESANKVSDGDMLSMFYYNKAVEFIKNGDDNFDGIFKIGSK